jgi:hypothetical protein
MRIATWNVNSLRVRLPQVLEWLARTPVDVPCSEVVAPRGGGAELIETEGLFACLGRRESQNCAPRPASRIKL